MQKAVGIVNRFSMLSYLACKAVICSTNRAEKAVDVVIVNAPPRTIWGFAVESVVARVILCLSDRFG